MLFSWTDPKIKGKKVISERFRQKNNTNNSPFSIWLPTVRWMANSWRVQFLVDGKCKLKYHKNTCVSLDKLVFFLFKWYFRSFESYENIRNTRCPISTSSAKRITLTRFASLCFKACSSAIFSSIRIFSQAIRGKSKQAENVICQSRSHRMGKNCFLGLQ